MKNKKQKNEDDLLIKTFTFYVTRIGISSFLNKLPDKKKDRLFKLIKDKKINIL